MEVVERPAGVEPEGMVVVRLLGRRLVAGRLEDGLAIRVERLLLDRL
jgi:hypothetical protein